MLEDTKDEQSGDTLKVTGESTLEDTKDEQSGDTSKVTGESTLEDTKDEESGDTTVNPGEADADKDTENLKKDSDDTKQERPKLVTLKPVENNVLGKKNSDLSMHSRETLMVNGGTGGENKVTIMVHSDVKGVVGSLTKKFREYTKGLKNMKVQLTSSPVVVLSRLDTPGEPDKRKLGMTSSVTEQDTTGKKVKIYMDEDLLLECEMIKLMAKLGQEMRK